MTDQQGSGYVRPKHADLTEKNHGDVHFEFGYLIASVRGYLNGGGTRDELAEIVVDCEQAVKARRQAILDSMPGGAS